MENVAAVDFGEVVDREHLDNFEEVDFSLAVLGEDDCGEDDLPGMLRGVFFAV